MMIGELEAKYKTKKSLNVHPDAGQTLYTIQAANFRGNRGVRERRSLCVAPQSSPVTVTFILWRGRCGEVGNVIPPIM
jgi:hypothetical protein